MTAGHPTTPSFDDLDRVAARCLWLRTEPHSIDRLWWLEDARRVDLDDLLATPIRARRSAATEARRRIDRLLGAEPVGWLVFDTTEGWLSTTLSNWAAREHPEIQRLGLQHGIFQLSGILAQTPVRQLRRYTGRLAERLVGFVPIGAGFGNNPFNEYLVLGALFGDYIRRLQPDVQVGESFTRLTSIGRYVTERPPPRTGSVERCVFLDQMFDGARSDEILRHLHEVAGGSVEILYRPHPKQVTEPAAAELVSICRDEPLADVLLAEPTTLFVSYFSTALHEAAWLGHPILAIRVPSTGPAVYESFGGVADIDRFLGSSTLDLRSHVRPGYVGTNGGTGRDAGPDVP